MKSVRLDLDDGAVMELSPKLVDELLEAKWWNGRYELRRKDSRGARELGRLGLVRFAEHSADLTPLGLAVRAAAIRGGAPDTAGRRMSRAVLACLGRSDG